MQAISLDYIHATTAHIKKTGEIAEMHQVMTMPMRKRPADRGLYGDTGLDGLDFIAAEYWPKAIHEGNGTL